MMPKQFIPGKSVTNSAQQRQGNFALAHKHGNFAGTPSSNLATKQGMNISNLATHNSSTNGSVEATPDPSEQQNKVPKPSATEVANKLLKVLLVSEPLSILDLCKIMPEVPRESVQSVLEVLQVLGLISQSASTKEPTSSRSSSSTNTISLFSMTDYAKFSSPIILADIETEVRKKQESTQNVSSRNEQLQELSLLLEDDSLSPDRRTTLLKEAIERLLKKSPHLWEDPLYQALISQLGCCSQPVSEL